MKKSMIPAVCTKMCVFVQKSVWLGLFVSFSAQAQQVVYQDQYGRVAGWSNQYGNQTVLQDRNGRVVGYSNRYDNQTVYQNRNGKVVGYANRYPTQDQEQDNPYMMYDPFKELE